MNIETDWINYRPLKKGEIIEHGDEVLYSDKLGWVKDSTCIGTPAPDPNFIAHRLYRRPVSVVKVQK